MYEPTNAAGTFLPTYLLQQRNLVLCVSQLLTQLLQLLLLLLTLAGLLLQHRLKLRGHLQQQQQQHKDEPELSNLLLCMCERKNPCPYSALCWTHPQAETAGTAAACGKQAGR